MAFDATTGSIAGMVSVGMNGTKLILDPATGTVDTKAKNKNS
jgi:hypothetical protein